MESIQGEGLQIGSRNVFLRFSGCNLRCSYCDTVSSFEAQPFCRISNTIGRGDSWEQIPNPLSVDNVLSIINNYSSKWVSFTGGEPLLWAEFVSEISHRLKMMGYSTLLETNGTLFEQLNLCLPYIDVISMDFKLPSATGSNNWDKHEKFLKLAVNKQVYIKIVIDSQVIIEEVEDAVEIIASIDRKIPLILQPATPVKVISSPQIETLLDLQRMCMEKIKDVRVIPQLHKLMGVI
jgi:organic radical activating enzyme